MGKLVKPFEDRNMDRLMQDIDAGRIRRKPNPFFDRPAYQYTKAEVGHVPDVR